MNADFVEMLSASLAEDVEFLLIGAHAPAVHGNPRATGDMDVWVRPSSENAPKAWRALTRFGAPLMDLTPEDLADPKVGFQIGVPPRRIDVLMSVAGVSFDDAWEDRVSQNYGGCVVPVIGREHMIADKRAAGRPKDLVDADWLEAHPHFGVNANDGP